MDTDREWVRDKTWETADRATMFGVLQSVSIALALGSSEAMNRMVKTPVGLAAVLTGIMMSTLMLLWIVHRSERVANEVGANAATGEVDTRGFLRRARNLRMAVLCGFTGVSFVLAIVVFLFGARG